MGDARTSPGPPGAQGQEGRLVYLPLDKVPKELLERLGNYKLFTLENKNGHKSSTEDIPVAITETTTQAQHSHRMSGKDLPNEDATRDHPVSDRPKATNPAISRTPPISPDTTLNVPDESDIFTFDPSALSLPFPRRASQEKNPVDKQHFQDKISECSNLENRHEQETEHPRSLSWCEPLSPHHSGQMHSPLYDSQSRQRQPVSRQLGSIHGDARHLGPLPGRQSTSLVSSEIDERLQMLKTMLEKTPSKSSASEGCSNQENIPRSPRRSKCVSWEDARRLTSLREMASPPEHQYYAQTPRARKQLFESSPVEFMERGYFDSNEIRSTRGYSPQYPDQHIRRPVPSRPMRELVGYPGNPETRVNEYDTARYAMRQKRKMPFEDGSSSPRKAGRTRSASDALDNMFQLLHPSKRHCCDEDIGPEPETTSIKKINCACAIMESNFLQMTQCAYKNIRRKDSSPEGFEQFKRELAQTNELLKQSVTLLRSIQEICSHRPQAS